MSPTKASSTVAQKNICTYQDVQKKSKDFFTAHGMAEPVLPVPPTAPSVAKGVHGRPVGQAGRERLPRASRPAPAPPVSPRWCWGLMAWTGCCQMANVGSGQGQGGAGARVPSCRAGKRSLVLRKQGKAVPAMILRAIRLQGSWPTHMEQWKQLCCTASTGAGPPAHVCTWLFV